jgi:1-deoxy-D-xylulose-5-phosphate reductoisomerase
MKKKIAILGSTGSIGKTLIDIIIKDKKHFEITLLAANKSHKLLLKQAKIFNVKNLIVTNKRNYEMIKKETKKTNIRVFNNFTNFDKIFKKKIDYVMSSISGIHGLKPTIEIIKFTKKIAIANKESIICGWNLIQSEIKKHKTEFIPVDSEHFSVWFGLKNSKNANIENIFLTASGGPFYKTSLKKFNKIKVSEALNHPNWRMGRKISTDSATMINKVYEVIEAKKLFNIDYNKIKIFIHPKSYIHAIIKFNNGLINIIAHDTTMKIPIFNTLFLESNHKLKTKDINVNILNNLNLNKVSSVRFPMIKLLKFLPKNHSLFETVIVSANDKLVELFLENKIKFTDIQKNLFKIINKKEFQKFKKKVPKNINDITNLNDYVRLKIISNSV